MANYRMNHRENNQRRIISERQEQPITAPMGNYRLDGKGQPILPSSHPPFESNWQSNSGKIYPLDNYRQAFSDKGPPLNPVEGSSMWSSSAGQGGNYRLDREASHSYFPSRSPIQAGPTHLSKFQALFQAFPKGRLKIAIVYLFFYTIMIASGWMILPFNKVNQVRIIGNQYIRAETILQDLTIYPLENAQEVLQSRKKIEASILAANPLIEDVRMVRENWRSIDIHIKEHQLVARYQNDQETYAFLSNGTLSDQALMMTEFDEVGWEDLPLVEGPLDTGAQQLLGQALLQIDESIRSQILKISPGRQAGKNNYVILEMKDGNQVHAVSTTLAEKINYYPRMMEQIQDRRGIINLEVGAYFSPFDHDTNSVKFNND